MNDAPSPQPTQTFADRLRGLMKEQRLAQVDIARLCGVSQSAVSLWLKKNLDPRPKTIKILGIRFEVNENWLLTGKGDKEYSNAKRIAESADKSIVQRLVGGTRKVRRTVIIYHPKPDIEKEYIFDAATDEQWELIVALIEASYNTIVQYAPRTHPLNGP